MRRIPESGSEASVLLVDDDAIVRAWLRDSIEGSEFRLAGEASTIAAALELVERRLPSLLLVDYRLPDGAGTDLVRRLRERACATPAVLMTAAAETGLNETAREAGAQGSVLKSERAAELLDALRVVRAGGLRYDPRHPRRPAGRSALSPRERDVLRLVAAGETNARIAGRLEIGEESVKTLVSRAMRKLGAHRRAEAVAEANRLKLL